MAAGSKFLEEYVPLEKSTWKKIFIALALGISGGVAAYGLYSYLSQPQSEDKGGEEGDTSSQPSTARSISGRSTLLRRIQDLKGEGNSLFSQKKFQDAISRYTDAIALCVEQTPVPATIRAELAKIYQNRAAAGEKLERWADIREDCTRALEIDGQYVKALFRRAKANENLGDLRDAILDSTAGNILEGFSNAEHLESAEKVLKKLCAGLAEEFVKNRTSHPPLSSSHVQTFLSSFVEDPVLVDRATTSEGAPQSDTMVNGHGDEKGGYEAARHALFEGDYAAVVPSCSAQLDSAPQDDDQQDVGSSRLKALLLRATFYLLQGCQSECESDLSQLENILKTMPDSKERRKMHANSLIKRSMLELQRTEIDAALESLRRAQDVDPENADVCMQQGQVYLVNDKIEDAMSLYDRAVELQPDSGVVNVQRDFIAVRVTMERVGGSMVDMQAALTRLERTVAKYSDCGEGNCLLGQLYMQLERFDSAMEHIEKAIKLLPRNAAYLVHKAICTLSWTGDPGKAMAILQSAFLVDPYFTMVHENMGSVELQRGNLDAGINHFQHGLECTRTQSEALQMLILLEVSQAQKQAAERFGLKLPGIGGDNQTMAPGGTFADVS